MTILKGENTETFLIYSIFFCPQEAAPVGSQSGWESLVRTVEEAQDDPFAESLEEVFTGVHCSNQALGGFFKEEKTKMLVLGFTLLTKQKEKFICISPTPSIFGRI